MIKSLFRLYALVFFAMTIILASQPEGWIGVLVGVAAIYISFPWSFIFLSNHPSSLTVWLCMAITFTLLYLATLKTNVREKT